MSDETTNKVNLHHKLLLGDPENFKQQPGLLVEHARTSEAMVQTNKTLMEIRAVALAALGTILLGFLTAVMALVYRGHP